MVWLNWSHGSISKDGTWGGKISWVKSYLVTNNYKLKVSHILTSKPKGDVGLNVQPIKGIFEL